MITNATPSLSVGGRVTKFHATQRLSLVWRPSAMNFGQWVTFFDSVLAMESAKSLSGHDFIKSRRADCVPTSIPDYEDFSTWVGTGGVDDMSYTFSVWPASVSEPRPMSAQIFVFEPPPSMQSYTFEVTAEFLTRWPLGTIMAEQQKLQPTAPQQAINSVFQSAQSHAEALHMAEGAGVGGAIASAVGWLARTGAMLGRAAPAIAADSELALPLLAVL